MALCIDFFRLCPVSLTIKLNFNISKLTYSPPTAGRGQLGLHVTTKTRFETEVAATGKRVIQ